MMARKATEALEDEHRTIQRAVAAVAMFADKIETAHSVDLDILGDTIRFFRVFGDECHHAKEDKFLFPLLESKGVPSQGCPLGALKKEHEKGRELLRQLAGARDEYSASNGSRKELLLPPLRGLVELYPTHIWKEDYLLMPLADKLLSSAEQQRLNQQFENVEAALGPSVHDELEEMATRLERAVYAAPQRAPVATAGTFVEFDFPAEIEKLKKEPAWQRGRNAKTIAKYPDLRVVLTIVRAGTRLREHHAGGRISVQTLAGHIRMHALDRTFDLGAGQALVLDRAVPHDVEAVQDSAFLLTIAWPERGSAGQI